MAESKHFFGGQTSEQVAAQNRGSLYETSFPRRESDVAGLETQVLKRKVGPPYETPDFVQLSKEALEAIVKAPVPGYNPQFGLSNSVGESPRNPIHKP